MDAYEKKVKEREQQETYKTDRLGPGSLMTLQSHINSSRLIMVNHQLGHAVNLVDSEPAKVSTAFEAPLGQFSGMLTKAEYDEEVIYKIEKNMYNYVLITYSKSTNTFSIKKRKEFEEHSEGFCTRYKNNYIDSLTVGDKIPKDTVVTKSDAFDKFGNYCMGRNLNSLYMISVNTMEDQFYVMNGADEMMSFYTIETRKIPINENDVLLNLYGDDETYQPMPEIGKKVKNGVLLGLRSINRNNAMYALKKKYLKRPEAGDKIFYAEGRVIDVDIYYNKDKSKLIDSPTNEQLNGFYLSELDYYRDVYEALSRIIENADDNGYKYSDELTILYKEAKNYLDSSAYYVDDENVFGNLLMVVKIVNKRASVDGTKWVGRGGNKGIVSLAPEDDYYKTESGVPVHVVIDALGVVGRLNPMVLNEHAFTACAQVTEEEIAKADTIEEKYEILLEFFDIVNKEEKQFFKKYYKQLNDDEREIFFRKVVKNGIYIIQDPIENSDMYDFEKMADRFPPKLERIVFPDGTMSLRRVIVSSQYFLVLKQDPIEKFAARSRGMIHPLYLLPSKSTLKKQGLDMFSDIAVRIGEAEIDLLLLCNIPEVVADYMAENSTSTTAKEEMSNTFISDSFDEVLVDDISIGSKKNKELIDANLEVLGSRLVIEYEDD